MAAGMLDRSVQRAFLVLAAAARHAVAVTPARAVPVERVATHAKNEIFHVASSLPTFSLDIRAESYSADVPKSVRLRTICSTYEHFRAFSGLELCRALRRVAQMHHTVAQRAALDELQRF
jgi:hypothetical protein